MQNIRGRVSRAAVTLAILCTLGSATRVWAQELTVLGPPSPEVVSSSLISPAGRVTIRDWPSRPTDGTRLLPGRGTTRHQAFRPPPAALQQGGTSKAGLRVLAAVGMGLVGASVGGQLGAALEPDCRCDDPGLKGFVIGMPIGAAAGAIFGLWLAR